MIGAGVSPSSGSAVISPTATRFRKGQGMNEPGQIVFEEAFALGVEERDDLLIVGRVYPGEAEIDGFAAVVERGWLQPVSDRAVLGVGIGQRIVDFEPDFALGGGDVLVEQLAHALGIDAVSGHLVAKPGRVIEAQGDRFLDLAQRLPRPGGKRSVFVKISREAA